mgnify:CR=1 FL=1
MRSPDAPQAITVNVRNSANLSERGVAGELEDLHRLMRMGALTEEEFAIEQARLLRSAPR